MSLKSTQHPASKARPSQTMQTSFEEWLLSEYPETDNDGEIDMRAAFYAGWQARKLAEYKLMTK